MVVTGKSCRTPWTRGSHQPWIGPSPGRCGGGKKFVVPGAPNSGGSGWLGTSVKNQSSDPWFRPCLPWVCHVHVFLKLLHSGSAPSSCGLQCCQIPCECVWISTPRHFAISLFVHCEVSCGYCGRERPFRRISLQRLVMPSGAGSQNHWSSCHLESCDTYRVYPTQNEYNMPCPKRCAVCQAWTHLH